MLSRHTGQRLPQIQHVDMSLGDIGCQPVVPVVPVC
jgi:hypothetical protein